MLCYACGEIIFAFFSGHQFLPLHVLQDQDPQTPGGNTRFLLLGLANSF